MNARERMDELKFFLEFWYGPHRSEYGEPGERLHGLRLPYPLRRFYRFAGRWPAQRGNKFFYTGRGHHLLALDEITEHADGRLTFFMEYQGDWHGLTLQQGTDPPVWIEGAIWDAEGREKIPGGTRQVYDSLSKFLVAHCLMTIFYDERALRLAEWVDAPPGQAALIWKADDCPDLDHVGSLFLVQPKNLALYRESAS